MIDRKGEDKGETTETNKAKEERRESEADRSWNTKQARKSNRMAKLSKKERTKRVIQLSVEHTFAVILPNLYR